MGQRTKRGPGVADAAASVALGLLAWAFLGPSAPDYDAMFALVWGDEIASGRSPELDLPFTPALRPVTVMVAAALSPLGDGAAEVFRLLVFVSLGAACVGLFRLGEELFGTAAGALAATILLTRREALGLTSQGFVDVPAAALVAWAAVLEARRPRRGLPVLALLSAAALFRPELFLVCGVYVLRLAAAGGLASLVRHGAFALLVPLSYVAGLALIAGDPVQDKAADVAVVATSTGLGGAIETLVRGEWGFLGPPLVAAALAGGVLWLAGGRGDALLPLAIAALGGLGFLVLGASGEPAEPRYLLPTVSLVAALAAGHALAAALGGRHGRLALAAAVVVLAASAARDAVRAVDLRDDVRLADAVQDDLRAIARSPASARGLALPAPRPAPYLAFWAGAPPSAFLEPATSGPALHPRTGGAAQALTRGLPDADSDEAAPPPPVGALALARNGTWLIYRIPADAR